MRWAQIIATACTRWSRHAVRSASSACLRMSRSCLQLCKVPSPGSRPFFVHCFAHVVDRQSSHKCCCHRFHLHASRAYAVDASFYRHLPVVFLITSSSVASIVLYNDVNLSFANRDRMAKRYQIWRFLSCSQSCYPGHTNNIAFPIAILANEQDRPRLREYHGGTSDGCSAGWTFIADIYHMRFTRWIDMGELY